MKHHIILFLLIILSPTSVFADSAGKDSLRIDSTIVPKDIPDTLTLLSRLTAGEIESLTHIQKPRGKELPQRASSINTSLPVGTIEGYAEVSSSGAATYNIPIKLLPGMNELSPSVSITYNSQSGNGLLGYGWNLSATSVIMRCGKSYYYDSSSSSPDMSTSDNLMLDGKRLILVSGSNLQEGAEYQLEDDPTTDITYHTSSDNSSYMGFTVRTKEGRTMKYGLFAGRMPSNDPYYWLLESVSDSYGNSINYSYSRDYTNYDFQLTQIQYGHWKKIVFSYETRSDIDTRYVVGHYYKTTKRLSSISVYTNSTVKVNEYTFSYAYDGYYSKLNSITLYGRNNQHFNPTTVNYTGSDYATQYVATYTQPRNGAFIRYGDFDGDGKIDIVSFPAKSSYTSSDSAFVYSSKVIYGTIYFKKICSIPLLQNFKDLIFADMNGDGKNDLVRIYRLGNTYRYNIFLSNGTSFTNTYYFSDTGYETLVGDFDGDGRQEIFVKGSRKLYNYQGTCIASSGINSTGLRQLKTYYSNIKFQADFNGDGKTNILIANSSGCVVYEYRNGSFFQLSSFANSEMTSSYEYACGDFNGDGLADVLRQSGDDSNGYDVTIFYSTGTNFTKQTYSGLTTKTLARVGNFNKDSKHDLMYLDVSSSSVTAKVCLFNGSSFTTSTYSTLVQPSDLSSTDPASAYTTMDYDGDGRDEFCCAIYNDAAVIRKFTDPNDLYASTISDGLGESASFSYQPLTDFYESTTTNTFPVIEITPTWNVVSQMYWNRKLTTYDYKHPKFHVQGRGFLGYDEMSANDEYTNIITTTRMSYNGTYYYPYVSQQDVSKSNGQGISTQLFTYTFYNKGNKRFIPYISTQTTTDLLKSITHTRSTYIDAYGNPVAVTTNFGDNLVENVSTSYLNTMNSSTWICGLPLRISKVSSNASSSWTEREEYTYNDKYKPATLTQYVGDGTKQISYKTFDYDTYGHPISVSVKPYNSSTTQTMVYDYSLITCKPSYIRNPRFVITNYGNDDYGNITSKVVNNFWTGDLENTSYEYDDMDRLVKETYIDGTEKTISYAWDTSLYDGRYSITESQTGKPQTITYYNGLGKELRKAMKRFDGTFLKRDTQYDNAQRISQTSEPYKGSSATNWTTYTYDSYNRLIEAEFPSGKTETVSYSGLTTTTTTDGIAVTRTVDVKNRLISSTDNAGTVTYSYRPDGQPASITAPGSIVTTLSYDQYGRRTTINDPSAGLRSFTYNSEGLIASQTDADSRTTSMTYNSYGEIISKSTPEMTTTYTYDYAGRLTAASSGNGTSRTYTYDSANRLSKEKIIAASNKWQEKTFSYSDGNLSSVSYDSHRGVLGTESYVYSYGNLSSISFGSQTIWTLDAENDMGQLSQATSGVVRSYTYNGYGKLTGIAAKKLAASSYIQNFTYGFNSDTENLSWRKDVTRNLQENFSYDALNRLTSYSGYSASYDAKGNLLSKGDIGTSFGYTNTSKPYAITEATVSSSSTYPTSSQSVTYTSFGTPATITDGSLQASFTYDDKGQRRMMQTNNLTRYYLGDNMEEDVNGSSYTLRLYLGGDTYSANAVYVMSGSSGAIHYICRDHLGSITHILNSSGNLEYEYSYDAWGRLRNPATQQAYTSGSEPILYLGRGYCGHEHLQGFSLINMNARLYDPVVGRFLSPDPYVQAPDNSQNFNRYSYSLNNPLKYVDKDGKNFWIIAVGIAIGAYTGGVISNEGKFNPAKWDYSSWKTYLGIGLGGVLGGIGGYAYNAGIIGLKASIVTPVGTLGVTTWNTKDRQRRNYTEYNTIAGGEYHSYDKKLDEIGDEAYDNAVKQMTYDYYMNINRVYESNPALNKIYNGTVLFNNLVYNGSEVMVKTMHNRNFVSLYKGSSLFYYGFIGDELVRDYYLDGGSIGYNFNKDVKKELIGGLGGAVGALIGFPFGGFGAFVGNTIGSIYMQLNVERYELENYIWGLQPTERNVMNYDFFYGY